VAGVEVEQVANEVCADESGSPDDENLLVSHFGAGSLVGSNAFRCVKVSPTPYSR
jgi:hypothetical protein